MQNASVVLVQYEELDKVVSLFEHHADQIAKVYRFLSSHIENLRILYWVGDNADIFYSNMDNEVMPAIKRLHQALIESIDTTRDIIKVFESAEAEAEG
jgi:WXG100 family type VII secretion target